MSRVSGLGRGLNSLIPSKKDLASGVVSTISQELVGQEEVVELPVDKISPNPHQPRSNFEDSTLSELVASIREHGIIQPLIAVKIGSDRFQLVAGERRLRAAKQIGLKTVPVIVRDLNEQKKLEIALIENLQRQDLNVLETAVAYKKLIDEFNLKQEQLGKKLGKSQPAIANVLRVLNATEEVKKAIIDNQITEGHARVLVGLPAEDQSRILSQIINQKLNVRETERAGREVVVAKHIRKLRFDPEIKAKEDELRSYFNAKVEIKKSGPRGQIVIKFFSEEELNDIMKKIL